jgi:hypothetical protein
MSAIVVADVVKDLAKKPYGWSELCALYVLNELVRRNIWSFKYMNQSANIAQIATNLLSDSNKFTIVPAAQVSGDVINDFVAAWNEVFNNAVNLSSTYDVNQLLRECRDNDNSHLRRLDKVYSEDYAALRDYAFAAPLKQALDVFQQLLAEKETLPFLQLFISKKNDNKQLLDTCKRIREFRDQQFQKYKDICQFVRENHDNFDFLVSEEDKSAITNLKAILSDANPMNNMPAYIKLHRLIAGKLDELFAIYKNNVKASYQQAFAKLRELAAGYKVSADKLPNEESTIILRTQSKTLYALDKAADVSDFYTEWAQKLYDIAQLLNPAAPTAPKVITRVVHTHTLATMHPLRSEADIDEYINNLREKLTKSLKESGKNGQVEIKN